MIVSLPLRWGGAVLGVVASALLVRSDRGWTQTAPVNPAAASTNGEEWQATDLSILDFVSEGYELVSVISPSSHTRIYFLTKPGKIVKCREEATPNSLPPLPLPPLAQGQVGTSMPSPPTSGQIGTVIQTPPPTPDQAGTFTPPDVGRFRTEFECAELLRGTSRQ
jgi:hypothetical protein